MGREMIMKRDVVVLMVLVSLFLLSCSNESEIVIDYNEEINTSNDIVTVSDSEDDVPVSNSVEVFTISKTGAFSFEECQDHGLGNSVVMIESEYCGHCRETRADFQAACDEVGVSCEFWDLAEKEGLEQLEGRSLMVQFTPTMIFGCSYSIGVSSKEEYLIAMQKFKQGEQ